MDHIDPTTVTSPRARLHDVHVLHDGGPGSWSVAEFIWDDRPAVGIRWNGGKGQPRLGNPQSRGLPTWFIVPREMEDQVRLAAERAAAAKKAAGAGS